MRKKKVKRECDERERDENYDYVPALLFVLTRRRRGDDN
jgi:hypothetical protein